VHDPTPADPGDAPDHDYEVLPAVDELRDHLTARHGQDGADLPRDRGALLIWHARDHHWAPSTSGQPGGASQGHAASAWPFPTGDPALTIPAFHGRTERVLRVLEDALDALHAVDPPGARSAAVAVVQRMQPRI
jgi:hypothetical protein